MSKSEKKALRKSLSDSLKKAGVKARVWSVAYFFKIVVADGEHSTVCDVMNANGFGSIFKANLEPRHFESDNQTVLAFPR